MTTEEFNKNYTKRLNNSRSFCVKYVSESSSSVIIRFPHKYDYPIYLEFESEGFFFKGLSTENHTHILVFENNSITVKKQ